MRHKRYYSRKTPDQIEHLAFEMLQHLEIPTTKPNVSKMLLILSQTKKRSIWLHSDKF